VLLPEWKVILYHNIHNLNLLRMKKLLFYLLFVSFVSFFNSCVKDEILEKNGIDVAKEIELPDVKVENGYLCFSDKEELNSYITQLDEVIKQKDNLSKSGTIINTPVGFCSLASRISKTNNSLKSGSLSYEEEEEAFLTELSKTLIPEEVIHYVVDTARKVMVAGKIHQITELGTFVYSIADSLEYKKLYESFLNNYNKFGYQKDSITYVYDKVDFIDTYGFLRKGDFTTDDVISMITGKNQEYTEVPTKSGNIYIDQNNTRTYDLSTFPLGGDNFVGKAVANFGINNWRSKDFGSENRVNVNLYELNYGFFKCAGFKVKFQYKHWVTIKMRFFRWTKEVYLYYYWRTTPAHEMVVGIEYFKGYTDYENFGLDPIPFQAQSNMVYKQFSDATAKMIYYGVLSEPSDKFAGWASHKAVNVFRGNLEFSDRVEQYGSERIREVVNSGFDWLESEFKNRASDFINKKIDDSRNSRTSMLLVQFDNVFRNREYLLLSGISNYNYCSERTVRLGKSSGGFSSKVNSNGGWSASPYTPNAFTIEDACIFGAVKFNGVWKGVRIYTHKK